MVKNFLPVSLNDVDIPLINGPKAAVASMGTGVYKDTVTTIPKAVKTKSWVMKMFSSIAFLGLIFGGTIVGFSFKIVGDDQVGYYYKEPGFMGPGIYFQFPWTKEEMKIVDVGREFIQFKDFTGTLSTNQEFKIKTVNVNYNVSDINQYINTLKDVKSPLYCQTDIEKAILKEIYNEYDASFSIVNEMNDIAVLECGIVIDKAILYNPVIIQKNTIISLGNQNEEIILTTEYDNLTMGG